MFPSQSNIMIIDDSDDMRAMLKKFLNSLGLHNLIEEKTAEDAISTLEAFAQSRVIINLLILDWKLPGMDGLTMFRTIRTDPDFATIPVLMISAKNESQDVIQAIAEGVTDYLIKPFDRELFSKKLAAVWNKTHIKC